MTGPKLADLLPNVDEPNTVMHIATQCVAATLASDGACCPGVATSVLDCTCWEQVYDVDQVPLVDLPGTVIPEVMPRGCHDCAYRADSPERSGAPEVSGDAKFLQRIVEAGEPFWCHDGMRQVIALTHPTGARIELPREVAYAPPIRNAVPHRANGQPGALCAGWSARRLRHVLANAQEPL